MATIYLPPTMSPTSTTDRARDCVEHPAGKLSNISAPKTGVGKVICEEKHMGSRAVVVICRDEDAALKRFGVRSDGARASFTRGPAVFDDIKIEAELLQIIRRALTAAGFWDEFASDWFCLDCELMPWSAKAQELLRTQYLPSAPPRAPRWPVHPILQTAADRYANDGLNALLERQRRRLTQVHLYVESYRRYCWAVRGAADLKLAPFHLLASQGKVHADQDHVWHMQTLAKLAEAAPDGPIIATTHRIVDVTDPADIEAGINWWEQLMTSGGEGMVVKPLDFVVRGRRGLTQPAVKCRGPEYLRIIYGPEYDVPENLGRLGPCSGRRHPCRAARWSGRRRRRRRW